MALLYTIDGRVLSIQPQNQSVGFTLEEFQEHLGNVIEYVKASDTVYFLMNGTMQKTATDFNKFVTRTLYVPTSPNNRAYYGSILAIELREVAESLKEEVK